MNERCLNCKWWNLLPKINWNEVGKQMGECRKNSPLPLYIRWKNEINLKERYPIWPWTTADDFCGDFCLKNSNFFKRILLKNKGK